MSIVVEKANRILTMIPLIRSNPGIRIGEIAKRLGVTPRTVASDLKTMLMCGVPPYFPDNYISVYIDNDAVKIDFADHFKRPVSLTPTEALALRLALQNAPALAGGRAKELEEKLDRIMPGNLPEKLDNRLRFVTGPKELRGRIETLEKAVEETREAKIEYYTAARDAMSSRVVRPYAIIEHDGQWYLIAFCLRRLKESRFRIDRIKSVELTEQEFERPADFDIESYRRPDMFVSPENHPLAEIRLKPELAAKLVPKGGKPKLEGAPSVIESKKMKDGSLVVKIPAVGTEWLISWAMQYGDLLEILSPPEQRVRMREVCDSLLRMYG